MDDVLLFTLHFMPKQMVILCSWGVAQLYCPSVRPSPARYQQEHISPTSRLPEQYQEGIGRKDDY